MKKVIIVTVSLSLIATPVSTAVADTGEDIGTIIGGGIGGILGSKIGGGTKEKIAAGILGAAAGAYLGRKIAKKLSERDQEKAAMSAQKAVITGEDQVWQSDQQGVYGTAKVTKTKTKDKDQKIIVLKDRVEKVPPLDLDGTQYQASKTVNVRGGPGTDYKVVNSLQPNSPVTVVGQVKDSDWSLISQGGVGTGFVFSGLLTPVELAASPAPEQKVAGTAETVKVETTQTCRTVKQEVTLENGKKVSENVTACQTPSGWQIT